MDDKPLLSDAAFYHTALNLHEDKPIVYTALSKHIFYYRMFIVKYVLEAGGVPLNPFMVFDYFLLGTVDRDIVRTANNNLVKRCDTVWVFGPISDGVYAEILIAQKRNIPVRFFTLDKSLEIKEVFSLQEMPYESDVKNNCGMAQSL